MKMPYTNNKRTPEAQAAERAVAAVNEPPHLSDLRGLFKGLPKPNNGDPQRSPAPRPEPIDHEPDEPIDHGSYARRSDPPHHEEERLRQLDDMINKIPLNDIAKAVKELRYEEMMEFVEGIRKADVDKIIPETINLAAIMHKWTK